MLERSRTTTLVSKFSPLACSLDGLLNKLITKYLFYYSTGYARVAFALYAFSVARTNPTLCFIFYLASFVCDELDGRFARMFNQTSTLGAVLDMVTDRVATSCLLAVLCTIYPSLQPIFLSLLMLDIFSHWFQMYATLAMGSATHKDVHSRSFIVRYYYKHRLFMGFCCVCVEALYLYAYLLGHEEYQHWAPVGMPKALHPIFSAAGFKLLPGGKVPLLCILCALVIPGFVIKQAINVVQLRTAAAQLVAYDQKQKRTKR